MPDLPCRRGCGKTFDRKTNRDRHETKKFPCSSNQVEEQEQENAGGDEIVNFQCSLCAKVFSKKYNLDRHITVCTKRNAPGRMQCYLCKKNFSRMTNLRRHMSIHNKIKIKIKKNKQSWIHCICKKRFRKIDACNKHQTRCAKFLKSKKAPSTEEFCSFIASSVIPELPDVQMSTEDAVDDTDFNVDESGPSFSLETNWNHTPDQQDGLSPVPYNDVQVVPNADENVTVYILDENSEFTFTSVGGVDESQVEQNIWGTNDDVPALIEDEDSDDDDNSNDDDSRDNSDREEDRDGRRYSDNESESFIGPADIADIAEELDRQLTFVKSSVRYINSLIHQSKRSIKKKISTAKYIKNVFNSHLEDNSFMSYLARNLKFENIDELKDYLKWADKDYSYVTGRRSHAISVETAERVVHFWKEHAVISVDRRNNRHQVRKSKAKCHPTYLQVYDEEVKPHFKNETETGKLEAHRHIYTKSFRKLYRCYLRENPTHFVSHGIFHKFKPFYIGAPTENEKESCLCVKCQNAHGLYEPIRKHNDELPASLTEFLTQSFQCGPDEKLSFVPRSCILSECENKCQPSTANEREFKDKTPKKYYVFEKVLTFYHNKDGRKINYERTTRVDKEATLDELYRMLKDVAVNYLLHRHSVVADRVFWSHMHEILTQPYIHLDYSENIGLKPKHEVQAMHFSGKEQTLHCTVLKCPDENKFIYHLSDDTIHDSTMTSFVLKSLVAEHPELIESGRLVLKSDNCSTQYKSRKVFEEIRKLAALWEIEIWWFYGEPGHGRGLVDAMSSFGCKRILREAIICEDVWFKDARQMVDFLKKQNDADVKKEYYFIDEPDTAARRRKGKKGLKREGCRRFCLMAVNKLGQWMVRDVLDVEDENLVNLTFDDIEDCYDTNDIQWTEIEETIHTREIPDELVLPIVYEVVSPEDFVALRSESESLEDFYLVQVVSKGVADEYGIEDDQGHVIAKGEPYFFVKYLEKSSKSTARNVKYSYSKRNSVLVHVGEVFATNVELTDVKNFFCMSAVEYQSLLTEMYG